jgi:hypothetical protein
VSELVEQDPDSYQNEEALGIEEKESMEADMEARPKNATRMEETQDRTLLMRDKPLTPLSRPEKQSSKSTLKKRSTPHPHSNLTPS